MEGTLPKRRRVSYVKGELSFGLQGGDLTHMRTAKFWCLLQAWKKMTCKEKMMGKEKMRGKEKAHKLKKGPSVKKKAKNLKEIRCAN
jgi:hypothetical protein